MPFLQDIGPREVERGTVWASFATVGGQVERMVALNLAWSLQLMPGTLALAFPQIPTWLRIVLVLYSATVLPPATAMMYAMAAEACRGQHVDIGSAIERLRELAVPSLLALAPLYGTFGVLIWVGVLGSGYGIGPLLTAVVFVGLLWSVAATSWGPAFVDRPERSGLALAHRSVRSALRHPEKTLGTWLVTGLFLLLGAVSIGGLFLIVPVLVAILQTHRYQGLPSPT